MKRPAWGTTIGVLMIIFGGCSVKNSLEMIYMPEMLESGNEIMRDAMRDQGIDEDSISSILHTIDSLKEKGQAQDSIFSNEQIQDFEMSNNIEKFVLSNIGDIFNMSDFTKTWMVRFGTIGIFVALLYAAGGFFMLYMKSFSIKLAYGVLALSIIFVIVRAVVLGSDSAELLSISNYFKSAVSAIIDIALVLVIFASDKFAYQQLSENM